jgi:hypothetical protein
MTDHIVFYLAANGAQVPVAIHTNVCGRVFSICHISQASRFTSAETARAAARAAGIRPEHVLVREVISPPDRDPAQSEMRGADSPAGKHLRANSANSRELEKFA